MRLIPTFLLALAGGCVDPGKESAADDTGYLRHDTSRVEDTAPPLDTDDTGDTDETGETDTARVESAESAESGETAETGETDSPPVTVGLHLYPATLVVNPGAGYALRAVATDDRGARADAPARTTWSADDPAVATVDAAGVVTALAEGVTTLRAELDGVPATATVEVRADLLARVTVTDALTGASLADAHVKLTGSAGVRTDATGLALLPVVDGAPAPITVFMDSGYDAVTFAGTVSRQMDVRLMPKQSGGADGTVHGQVSFAGVQDAAWDETVIGLAAATMQGSLATLDLDALFAAPRDLTLLGVEASVPANVVVEGTAEDYYAPAYPGPVGAWGLAGPIPLSEAAAGFETAGDALHLLIDHLGEMSWAWVGGAVAGTGTQIEIDLAPVDRFLFLRTVTLPALSLGFRGDEEFLVLATEERADEGFVVTGLGMGAGSATVSEVSPGLVSSSLGTTVLAYAEVGGLGAGGGTSAAIGRVDPTNRVALPPLQDVPILASWDAVAHEMAISADPEADFIRVRLEDRRHNKHDFYLPASWGGEIPNSMEEFGLASATIEILTIETVDGSFEDRVSTGALDPGELSALTAARFVQEH